MSTIDFAKTLPRDSRFYKTLEYAPDYQPNPEFCKKQLPSCGAPFFSSTPRKSQVKPYPSANENHVEYDKFYASQSSSFFPRSYF